MLRDKRYIEIVPTRNSVGTAFKSEIRIEYNILQDHVNVFSEGYTLFKVTIATDGDTALTKPIVGGGGDNAPYGLAQAPAACLFDQISLKHNDVTVEILDEATSIIPLMSLLDRDYCQNEKNYQGNPIYALDTNYTYHYNGLAMTSGTTNSSVVYQRYRILKEMQNDQSNVYMLYLPNPFLRGVGELGSGKITLAFQVSPQWATKLFYGSQNLGVKPIQQDKLPSGTPGIYFYVEDIKHYAMFYETVNPQRGLQSYIYDTPTAVVSNLPIGDPETSKTIRLEVPTATNFVAMVFKPTTDTATNQSSWFGTVTDHPVVKRLKRLSFRFGGINYPEVPFNFVNGFSTGSSADSYRCYNDYLVNTGMNKTSSILSFREYLTSPIFCWRIVRPQGDTSSTFVIELEFIKKPDEGESTPETDILLACFETHQLSFEIDENGLSRNTMIKTVSV